MALTTQRRKRGADKASVTRLQTKIKDLESHLDGPDTPAQARHISERLKELDSIFKEQHFAVIELMEEEYDEFDKEQEVLDKHDDEITAMTISIEKILTSTPPAGVEESTKGLILRRLHHTRKKQEGIFAKLQKMVEDSSTELCYLHHYEQESQDHKRELAELRNELLALDVPESDESNILLLLLEDSNTETLIKLRKALHVLASKASTAEPSEGKGVRLPKIDVPKFDGAILNWRSFWEQFVLSIDNQSSLSEAEKMAYLRSSLMGGNAKHVIKGVSRTGECYKEAIECLKARYDRPKLIHQTHVQMIVEATPLKEGNGKELHRLHDTVQQHSRALKAIGPLYHLYFGTEVGRCLNGRSIAKIPSIRLTTQNSWSSLT